MGCSTMPGRAWRQNCTCGGWENIVWWWRSELDYGLARQQSLLDKFIPNTIKFHFIGYASKTDTINKRPHTPAPTFLKGSWLIPGNTSFYSTCYQAFYNQIDTWVDLIFRKIDSIYKLPQNLCLFKLPNIFICPLKSRIPGQLFLSVDFGRLYQFFQRPLHKMSKIGLIHFSN